MTDEVKATVIWSNVWTSRGKYLRGDEAVLPKAEAAALAKDRAVKVAQKKAKSDE